MFGYVIGLNLILNMTIYTDQEHVGLPLALICTDSSNESMAIKYLRGLCLCLL